LTRAGAPLAAAVLAAGLLAASAPAGAAVAVFQGEVTRRYSTTLYPFASLVTATVDRGTIAVRADDPGWSMGIRPNFSRRDADGWVTFQQLTRYGPAIGFVFAGATAHIQVYAASPGTIVVKSAGGVTLCDGTLGLASGDLDQALVP
jgi:hypothetical protein